jgi:zinc D-Ala-D-Ala carboxypeptidase
MRRHPLAPAVLAALALLAVPLAGPAPAAAVGGPLPDCRVGDVLTIPRGYDSWATTLVDWTLSVGKGYKPPDLVPVGDAGLPGGGLIRKVAIDDLRALAKAAKANGTPIGSFSAYRSYATQVSLFNSYSKGYGYAAAITFSARPGHSEHQLGLAIDFSPAGFNGFISGDSAVGKWMAKNAWRYGWILSYPKGQQAKACLRYEPWHFRYFGRDLAAAIHASGLTSREYLWRHDTLVDPTTGLPIPTATPPASPSPAPSDAASPPSPSDGATAVPGSPIAIDTPAATPPTAAAGSSDGIGTSALVIALAVLLGALALTVWRGAVRRSGGSGGAAASR